MHSATVVIAESHNTPTIYSKMRKMKYFEELVLIIIFSLFLTRIGWIRRVLCTI